MQASATAITNPPPPTPPLQRQGSPAQREVAPVQRDRLPLFSVTTYITPPITTRKAISLLYEAALPRYSARVKARLPLVVAVCAAAEDALMAEAEGGAAATPQERTHARLLALYRRLCAEDMPPGPAQAAGAGATATAAASAAGAAGAAAPLLEVAAPPYVRPPVGTRLWVKVSRSDDGLCWV